MEVRGVRRVWGVSPAPGAEEGIDSGSVHRSTGMAGKGP